jgi:hypothetical protein
MASLALAAAYPSPIADPMAPNPMAHPAPRTLAISIHELSSIIAIIPF